MKDRFQIEKLEERIAPCTNIFGPLGGGHAAVRLDAGPTLHLPNDNCQIVDVHANEDGGLFIAAFPLRA